MISTLEHEDLAGGKSARGLYMRDTKAIKAPVRRFREVAENWLPTMFDWTEELASPALAWAWADAIVDTWLAWEVAGMLEVDQALLIVDLAPGKGRLAHVMLPRLRVRLKALGRDSWCVRYVAVLPNSNRADADAAEARTDATFSSSLCGDPWFECHNAWPEMCSTSNPWVALSVGGLGRHVPDAYAVHHGHYFEATVEGAPDEDGRLLYEWRRIPAPAEHAPLMRRYAARMPSAPVLLARETFAQLERLARRSRGRYLLLAVDFGIASEAQLRAHRMVPPSAVLTGEQRWLVNFDAVAWHQRQQGTRVRNIQLSELGWVVHVALRENNEGAFCREYEGLLDLLVDNLTFAHPECASPKADAIGCLYRSRFDPQLFAEYVDDLCENGREFDAVSAAAWRTVCEEVWKQVPSLKPGRNFLVAFARFAQHIRAHSLARTALWACIEEAPDDVEAWCMLAECDLATGRQTRAVRALSAAASVASHDPACNALIAQLADRRARWPSACDPSLAAIDELAIEPLAAYHAEDMHAQLSDPEICVLAGLPPMTTPQEVLDWIAAENQSENRLLFAVLHRDFGFVGVVAAHLHSNTAHFYFWIGADYQGMGIGRRAAELLFVQLGCAGVTEIFTTVYIDNGRSRRALISLGFRRVRTLALAPHADVLLYRMGIVREGSADLLAARFEALSAVTGAAVRFVRSGQDEVTRS